MCWCILLAHTAPGPFLLFICSPARPALSFPHMSSDLSGRGRREGEEAAVSHYNSEHLSVPQIKSGPREGGRECGSSRDVTSLARHITLGNCAALTNLTEDMQIWMTVLHKKHVKFRNILSNKIVHSIHSFNKRNYRQFHFITWAS